MASIANEEDPQQQTNQTPSAGAPVTVGGTGGASASGGQGASGSGAAAPAAAGASPVAGNSAPQASAGYVDVGSYLDANKAGSQKLGNQVADNLTGDYNSVKGGIDQSANATQSLADQGYTHENADLINHAASDPVAVAATAGNGAAVQAQLNDSYAGPNAWDDLGTQAGNVAAGVQEGNLVNTPGGLNVLSQKVEGNQTSQGINQLDTLLLGGNPDAVSTVKAASDPFNTLGSYLDSQNNAVKGSISTAQTNAATAKANANAALLGPTGATTQLTDKVNQETLTAQQQAALQNATIKKDVTGYTPSDSDLANMGVTKDQWAQFYNSAKQAQTAQDVTSANGQYGAKTGTTTIDPTSFLYQADPNAVINNQNAATADDYARAQALQSLVGKDKFTTNLTDSTLAGTAPKNLSAFDAQGANYEAANSAGIEKAAAQAYVDAIEKGQDDAHAQLAAKTAADNYAVSGEIGSGVGTVAGGIVGSLFAGVGAGPGAAIGSVLGNTAGRGAYSTYDSLKNDIRNPTNKTTGVDMLTGGAETAVMASIHSITSLFCFHPDTLITMHDGQELPISQVEVGDLTKGGRVLQTSRAVGTDFYMYNGVLVTAMHAVNHFGEWMRVKDTPISIKCPAYTEVVCNLVTEKHRIYASGVEFADEHETDEYESLNLQQSIDKLNSIRAR